MRARSPSRAPPERVLDGSTASTPTERERPRSSRASAAASVLLPTPGGPVRPMRCTPARGESDASRRSMRACDSGRRSSIKLRARATAVLSARAMPAASSASVSCDMRAVGALGHERDQVTHDGVQLEVLRRVHARNAGLTQALRIGFRNDAADDDRHIAQSGLARALHDLRHEL